MALDMFLKISKVDGESQDDTHAGEIDILSWNWGMSQSGTTHQGGGGGAGKANFQDITFVKYIDKATGNLMRCCAKGTHIDEAVLTVRKAGDTPLEYVKITMKKCLVSSISTGGNGGEDRLTETFSLNFAEVRVEYQQQAEDGSGTPGPEFGWNIPKNIAA